MAAATAPADICLIAEGCYPYTAGGVSAWIQWLMESQPHLSFSIMAILPGPPAARPRYEAPANLVGVHHVYLSEAPPGTRRSLRSPEVGAEDLASLLIAVLTRGDLADFRAMVTWCRSLPQDATPEAILASEGSWAALRLVYERLMPHAAFLPFFWAFRSLIGGLLSVLLCPLPKARVYHCVSTGYAGLAATRASLETGCPALVTEHGIYTNERRIEILLADWIVDSVDRGVSLSDGRLDIRDLWVSAFESYARPCYAAAQEIVSLFEVNRRAQVLLGAAAEKTRIIRNGIDAESFATPLRRPDRPTIALIGRVAPIKDVETFIRAAALLRTSFPALRALVLGPLDEDPDYARACQSLAAELGIAGTVLFTGAVAVREYLPEIEVVVLTSLSEGQPLALLEAGAAGVACVATDVGACREIIEGAHDERPAFGRGGLITPLVSPVSTAEAVSELLGNSKRRRRYGEQLRGRIRAHYSGRRAAEEYAALYARCLEPVQRAA